MFYSFLLLCLIIAATFGYDRYFRGGQGATAIKKKIRLKYVEYPLTRNPKNPIISPVPYSNWQSECAFNPAVIQDDEGKVHMIFRAIGSDGVSRFGYAWSNDGVTFERLPFPVFEPSPQHLEKVDVVRRNRRYSPTQYPSGGSWGGYEDPRLIQIGERIYLLFVAFGSWNSIRIGLTSISLDDLKQKKWNWKHPIFISPDGERHKNWLLFPEKINGKYAIIHGIVPKIYIDYVDSLTEPFVINSKRPDGVQPGRKDFWDNRLRGIGPPPIKTGLGWLILYHAVDEEESHKYKLGAMIVDLHDPTNILYRSPEPVLTPDMPYENDGKPGIVYASGAFVNKGTLYVYYGGGDKHVCVAETKLEDLIKYLVTHGKQ